MSTVLRCINPFVRKLAYGEYANKLMENSRLNLQHLGSHYIQGGITAFLKSVDTNKILEYRPAQDAELVGMISKREGIGEEHILITQGADGALHHVAETFLSIGKRALISVPSFPRCEFHTGIVGAKPIFINVLGRNKSGKLSPIAAEAKERKYSVIFLETPNNPTGEAVTFDALREFLSTLHETVVVIDQALGGYFNDSFSQMVQDYPNLIIVKSFSKLFGLPGLRIGYLIGSRDLVSYIRKTISPFAVSTIALLIAKFILDDDRFVEKGKNEVRMSLDYIKKELIIDSSDSKGPFILLDGGRKVPHLHKTLLKQGIITINGKNFRGLEKTNTVRVSLGHYKSIVALVKFLNKIC